MYGMMGMAVLAKGPIGLVLPTAIIGMFLLIQRLPESQSANGLPHKFLPTIQPIAKPIPPASVV